MSEYSLNGVLSSTVAEQTLMELGGIPIDRVAWRVIGPGEHYERPAKLRMLCFDDTPPVVDRTYNHVCEGQEATKDLRGIRVGRLTVIGYWGRNNKKRKGKWEGGKLVNKGAHSAGTERQMWICRCLCGLFTLRSAKVIIRKRFAEDRLEPMCNACFVDHIVRLGFSKGIAFDFVKDRGKLDAVDRCKILDALGIGEIGKRTA